MSIVLILDSVRSAHNVGSVLRTCDCLGVDEVWLVGSTPIPENFAVSKTALGAELVVRWRHFMDYDMLLSAIKKPYRRQIIVIEQTDSSVPLSSVNEDNLHEEVAVVLGNETGGVSKVLIDAADMICELPMKGMKKSLNVSVCGGIILYDLVNKHARITRGTNSCK